MPLAIALPEEMVTRRLIGRRPRDLDVPFMRMILQDDAAMRWLAPDGKRVTDARVAWLLDRLSAHWRAHDFGPRLFFLRDGAENVRPGHELRSTFAGWCGLRHQLVDGAPEVLRLGGGHVEVDWVLLRLRRQQTHHPPPREAKTLGILGADHLKNFSE